MRINNFSRIFTRWSFFVVVLLFCLLFTNPPCCVAVVAGYPSLQTSIKAHVGEVVAVDISPDGRLIVSGGVDGLIRIWNIINGKELHTFGENQEVTDVVFSPAGQRVLCAARKDFKKDVLQVWDYKKEKLREEIEGHTQRINTVAYSPDGKQIASGSSDNTIRTWYANNGRAIQIYRAGKNDVLDLNWSPDSDYITTGVSWDANVLVWDVSRDQLVKNFDGHGDWVTAVIYSPDGLSVISGSRDGSIKIWDLAAGEVLNSIFEEWWGGILSLAISSDGSLLAAATEKGGIVVWYLQNGKILDVFDDKSTTPNDVKFAAEGTIIVSGSNDGTVKIWSVPGVGGSLAMYALAVKHEKGVGRIKKDKGEAFKWYLKAAEAGYLDAMTRVGEMYAGGEGVSENPQEAVRWLTAAVVEDHVGAMYALGNMYASGEGVKFDQGKAVELWSKAADKGHTQAGLQLRKVYGSFDIATIDSSSLEWHKKVARAGDVKVMYGLGRLFRYGANDIPPNSADSFKWFMAAAKKGHGESMYYAAGNFEKGDGVNKSISDALKWYARAASGGNVKAQYKLGRIYANGDEVTRNYPEAVKWLKKAAGQGNVGAKYKLGIMYCTGNGVEQEYVKAVDLWRSASRKGDAMSTFFLAYMYETGSGIKRDLNQARKLYNIASAQGNIFATKALSELD